MTAMTYGAWLCLLAPLVGSILILLGGSWLPRAVAAWIATTECLRRLRRRGLGVPRRALGTSAECLRRHFRCTCPRGEITTAWTWLAAGHFSVGLQLLVDPLSTMMMLIVSGVGGLIVLYSIGYMDGDDEERRYFAYIAFFVFSMLLLVEGGNLLMLLVGWGLVGLSSYLLIGFWHERPSAVRAAKKAFVMNAFGDATMALAFFILIAHTNSLSFTSAFGAHLSSTDGRTSSRSACSAAPWRSRRRSRSRRGCRTRWKARRRSAPSSTRPRW